MLYSPPPREGSLRQGELLGPIWNHAVSYPPREVPWGQQVTVRSRLHDLAIVLTPDCDLEWDYEMRFLTFVREEPMIPTDEHSLAVDRVLLCHLQDQEELRTRFTGKREIWNRVKNNQDERYHAIPAARIAGVSGPTFLHKLYLDFKKVTSVATGELYDGVLAGSVERVALLPPDFLHDMIQRFAGFMSRVALP